MDLHDRPLPRYTSSLLTVPHGLFTSAGGVSSGPFAALNLSFHVGDREDNVRSNRAAAAGAMPAAAARCFSGVGLRGACCSLPWSA